jgi:hypothetical protein
LNSVDLSWVYLNAISCDYYAKELNLGLVKLGFLGINVEPAILKALKHLVNVLLVFLK